MLPQTEHPVRKIVKKINQPSQKKEKEEYVRDVFDAIAKPYDLMNGLMSFGMHKYWRWYAVRQLGIFPGAQVLDCCTGTAFFAKSSARLAGAKGRVVGFDFSAGMLKYARQKKNNKPNTSPIFLQQANALYIPYKPAVFDFVTVGWGIRNLSDIDQGLREVHRVLKPGGKFACLDLGRPVNPIYARLFYFFFFYVVPQIGKLVANHYEAYSYLPHSLATFPKQAELQSRLQQAGFEKVHYINLAGGATALHLGEKPESLCKNTA